MTDDRTLYKIVFGLTALLFTSCATTFNTKKTSVRIRPDKNIKVITVENNIKLDQKDYIVFRSQENLKIKIQADSTTKTINIPARKSLVYWENILNFGIGFLIDNKTQKRFSYPKQIFLEKEDSLIKVVSYPTTKKRTIELCLLLPYANAFLIRTNNGFYPAKGFLGIGIGANYYYKDNNYISFNTSACMDNPVPFPIGVDYFGEYQQGDITFINLRHHNKFGRYDLGYGFSYSTSNWDALKFVDSTETYLSSQNINLGLSFSLKCHLLKFISAGVIYQPSFVCLNRKPTFEYQDFITFEIAANLKVRRPKRQWHSR